jgi:hypothetical protein
LFREGETVELKERYASLQCSGCGKVDEEQALKRGIDIDVQIQSKSDYVLTNDGFIVFSAKLLDLLKKEAVHGFKTQALPGDKNYVVAWPTCLVPTNSDKAGIEVHEGICNSCGRPKVTTMLPTLSSMKIPDQEMFLFMSEIWAESRRAKEAWFTTTASVVALLKRAKITGVEYNEPF